MQELRPTWEYFKAQLPKEHQGCSEQQLIALISPKNAALAPKHLQTSGKEEKCLRNSKQTSK